MREASIIDLSLFTSGRPRRTRLERPQTESDKESIRRQRKENNNNKEKMFACSCVVVVVVVVVVVALCFRVKVFARLRAYVLGDAI